MRIRQNRKIIKFKIIKSHYFMTPTDQDKWREKEKTSKHANKHNFFE